MTSFTAILMAVVLGIMGADYSIPTEKITNIESYETNEENAYGYRIEETYYNRHGLAIGQREYDEIHRVTLLD